MFQHLSAKEGTGLFHLLMQAPFPIAIYRGEEFHIEFANKKLLEIWGVTWEEVSGKPRFSVFPQSRELGMGKALYRVYQTGERYVAQEVPVRFIRNGTEVEELHQIVHEPLRDPEGNLSGVMAVGHNVTEQIRARRKVEESEDRFRAAFSNASVGIAITAPDGRFLQVNKAYSDIVGYSEEELRQTSFQNITHPEDKDKNMQAINDLIAGRTASVALEKRYLRKDGGVVWMKLSISLTRDEAGNPKTIVGLAENITEAKATREKLQESEKRFRTMADNAPVMIWLTDSEGYCNYLNKQWLEFTGQTLEEGKGIGWTNAIHPDERESASREFLAASEAGAVYKKEYRLRKWDGSYEWVIDSALPRRDEQGTFLGYIGSVVNIHQRKLAEEELRHLSYHLQLSTTAAGVGTWSLDLITRKLEWSGLHKKMWGFEENRTDLTFEDWRKVILPADREAAAKQVAESRLQHTQYVNEYRIQRANDGVIRWMRSFGQYFYNDAGEAITLSGISIDITEQKKAEEAIKQSEEQFRTLAESLPQLIWITDAEGNPLYASSRWHYYSGASFTGMEEWWRIVFPDDLRALTRAWRHSLQSGATYRAGARLKNKEGQYRWHAVHGEPIRDEEGKISRWIGAFTDIHDQKTVSENLENQVAERTRELQRSNEDLQQFAHVASHDLKEPVRKIKTFAGRLQEEMAEQLGEKGGFYLGKVQSAADRIYTMIDGVLAYSTLDTLEQIYEPVDLNEVLKDIETDLEVLIQQKQAAIRCSGLPTIEGAPVLLYQLFYNLVNNSLKFTRPDQPPLIAVSCSTEHTNGTVVARIRVQDNGIGFDQEYADRIFGTFARLNSKDKYEGTGLGLALCKKIVERHGGSIAASGVHNQGALFEIDLPFRRPQNHQAL